MATAQKKMTLARFLFRPAMNRMAKEKSLQPETLEEVLWHTRKIAEQKRINPVEQSQRLHVILVEELEGAE